jgi:hypothetical protein
MSIVAVSCKIVYSSVGVKFGLACNIKIATVAAFGAAAEVPVTSLNGIHQTKVEQFQQKRT